MTGWELLERRLAEELAALGEHEFLVVGEPPPPQPPRPGPLRRRPAPPPHRYVQVLHAKQTLWAECVGATVFGGDYPLTDEQHAAIRALGWHAPGDPHDDEPPPAYPNYWRTVADDRVAEVGRLVAGALRVLGLEPDGLTWERDGR